MQKPHKTIQTTNYEKKITLTSLSDELIGHLQCRRHLLLLHDDGEPPPAERRRVHPVHKLQAGLGRDDSRRVQLLQQVPRGAHPERVFRVEVSYLPGRLAEAPAEFVVPEN